jgi:hypothetical protein
VTLFLRVGVSGVDGASEAGEVMGVNDAIVPLIPVREVGDNTMLSGALRVIEQLVESIAVYGAMRAGLCGNSVSMTKSVDEAVLSLR